MAENAAEKTAQQNASIINQVLENLDQKLYLLETQNREMSEALVALREEARQVLENTEQQSVSTVNQAVSVFREESQQLLESTEQQNTSTVNEAIAKLDQKLDLLEARNQEMSGALKAFKIATREMMENTEQQNASTFNETIDKISRSLEEQRQEMSEALIAFRDESQQLLEDTEQQSTSTINQAITKLDQKLASLEARNQEMSEALIAFRDESQQLLEDTEQQNAMTLNETIDKISRSLEEQRQEMNMVLAAFRGESQQLLKSTEQQSTSTVNEAIAKLDQKLDLLEARNQEMSGALKAFKIATREMMESTEQQNASTLNETIDKISRSLEEQRQEMSEALIAFRDESQQLLEDTEEQSTSTINEAIERLDQKLISLEAQNQEMSEALIAFRDESQQLLESTEQQSTSTVNEAIAAFRDEFQQLLESTEQQSTSTVNEAIEKLDQKLISLEAQNQEMSKALIAFREKSQQLLESTEQQNAITLNETIDKISRSLEEQRQEMSKAVAAFREESQQLLKSTEQQSTSTVNEAIERLNQKLASLEVRNQEMSEALVTFREESQQLLESTEQQGTSIVNQAIEKLASLEARNQEMSKAIADFRKEAQQLLENTEQRGTSIVNQTIEKLASLESRNQEMSEAITAFKIATREMMENTEQQNASALSEAIEYMNQKIDRLSAEDKQELRKALEPIAAAEAREVAESVVGEKVAQEISAVKAQEIQAIKQQYSSLLQAGFRTILLAAIEATMSLNNGNGHKSTQEKVMDTAQTAAMEAAGGFVLANANQTLGNRERQSYSFPFEKCHWTNKGYTDRLVEDYGFFHLSDPFQRMLEKWDSFQAETERTEIAEDRGSCAHSSLNGSSFPRDHSRSCVLENGHNVDDEKTLENEFAYLLHNDFFLAFFQESIEDIEISKDDDVPLECFLASAVRGADMYKPGKSSFYYCERDSNRPGNMPVTDENNGERVILPRRACLNRDYMYLTAIAFNKTADCFGFDKSEKERIFKLFNHESSFLHNIRSPGSARCFGQLTEITIEEIHRQIYFRDTPSRLHYSGIFDDVIKKCPGLQSAVLDRKIYESVEQAGGKSDKRFRAITSRLPISCKVTQSPYSCLFYAFYNIKINSVEIEKRLKKPISRFSEENNIPHDFRKRFFLPIPLDKMVGVTIEITNSDTNTTTKRDIIFWDDSELWPALKNRSEGLSNIRELPLFENEEEVKELFSLWAYNGGISIPKTYMIDFIRQLKLSITTPCSPSSKEPRCKYRLAVMSEQGVTTADIKREFEIYIRNNYRPKKNGKPDSELTKEERQKREQRKREVAYFVNNVEQDLNYFHSENGQFRAYLKRLVPDLTDQEIEGFQSRVRDVCPKH